MFFILYTHVFFGFELPKKLPRYVGHVHEQNWKVNYESFNAFLEVLTGLHAIAIITIQPKALFLSSIKFHRSSSSRPYIVQIATATGNISTIKINTGTRSRLKRLLQELKTSLKVKTMALTATAPINRHTPAVAPRLRTNKRTIDRVGKIP